MQFSFLYYNFDAIRPHFYNLLRVGRTCAKKVKHYLWLILDLDAWGVIGYIGLYLISHISHISLISHINLIKTMSLILWLKLSFSNNCANFVICPQVFQALSY